jgi:predicted DNA-binding protein with PD1-like motif
MAKIYSLKAGARIPEDIVSIARREKFATARVEAIGGVDNLRLAFYNHKTSKYEEHEYAEFLEVTGMIGNVTLKDSRPFLHAHGTFGRRDLSVIGGHIMTGRVYPLLEVVMTPTVNKALRGFDKRTGLNIILETR